jgi:hypothetical protein
MVVMNMHYVFSVSTIQKYASQQCPVFVRKV